MEEDVLKLLRSPKAWELPSAREELRIALGEMLRGADGHDACVPPPPAKRGPEVALRARTIALPGDHERVIARHFTEATEELRQGPAEQHVRLQVEHGAELREVPHVHLEEGVCQALLPLPHLFGTVGWTLDGRPFDDACLQLGHVLSHLWRSVRGEDNNGPLLVELPDAVDCSGQAEPVRLCPVEHECVCFGLLNRIVLCDLR
eukprot:CAMPEP_0175191102 /NCGR_PEP_ID=MMETSP0093-20121207/4773_1 /TAXON_ID=311494 /ORGANISM="Alexandrium monilatum, Strain CCMP3105" /LENGTH=203 /DNA_ID=CAMNT_0016483923 /DNA_START=277 /DNA_END=888 /DNA_ORIENTATION=+